MHALNTVSFHPTMITAVIAEHCSFHVAVASLLVNTEDRCHHALTVDTLRHQFLSSITFHQPYNTDFEESRFKKRLRSRISHQTQSVPTTTRSKESNPHQGYRPCPPQRNLSLGKTLKASQMTKQERLRRHPCTAFVQSSVPGSLPCRTLVPGSAGLLAPRASSSFTSSVC